MQNNRILYILPRSLSWWFWLAVVISLVCGITISTIGFLGAIFITYIQIMYFFIRDKGNISFAVELRFVFMLILIMAMMPRLHILFWISLAGTSALLLFGYCLLARILSLMPWHRKEKMSLSLLKQTFFSRPVINESELKKADCSDGLCSISAQVPSYANKSYS
jgi:hypothetical protein